VHHFQHGAEKSFGSNILEVSPAYGGSLVRRVPMRHSKTRLFLPDLPSYSDSHRPVIRRRIG